jgi:hypothetical protein
MRGHLLTLGLALGTARNSSVLAARVANFYAAEACGSACRARSTPLIEIASVVFIMLA